MRKEFLIRRQGKEFVLYAGLLDDAHDKGLVSLETEALQVGADFALFKATATLVQDGVKKVFIGHGDASPANIAPAMVPSLIRLAETRAKARALRDAVNVGVTAFEELGGKEEMMEETPRQRATPRPASKPENDTGITATQLNAIQNLCKQLEEPLPVGVEEFTNFRAAQEIKGLSDRLRERRAG